MSREKFDAWWKQWGTIVTTVVGSVLLALGGGVAARGDTAPVGGPPAPTPPIEARVDTLEVQQARIMEEQRRVRVEQDRVSRGVQYLVCDKKERPKEECDRLWGDGDFLPPPREAQP